MWSQNIPLLPKRHKLGSATFIGFLFYFEFVLLFQALDWTTVSRVSLLFYTMPTWLAICAHFVFPNERLSPKRTLGLIFPLWVSLWRLSSDQMKARLLLLGTLWLSSAHLAVLELRSVPAQRGSAKNIGNHFVCSAFGFRPFVIDQGSIFWTVYQKGRHFRWIGAFISVLCGKLWIFALVLIDSDL